jgi:integrase
MGRHRRREEGPVRVRVVKRGDKKYLALRWVNTDTGEKGEQSSGTTIRREAERAAGRLADEIEAGQLRKGLDWAEFCRRYEAEHLSTLADATAGMWETVLGWLDELEAPKTLEDLDADCISRFRGKLLQAKQRKPQKKPKKGEKQSAPKTLAPSTVAAYLAHLRSALSWAQRIGLIKKVPPIEMPRRAKGVSQEAQSRAVFGEEYERMILAAERVRPHDFKQWQDFIAGLWCTGFRPGELYRLSWEPTAGLCVDASGPHPLFRITQDAEKAHCDRIHPMDPEFWVLIRDRPRRGFVFPLLSFYHGERLILKTVEKIVSRIGRRSGIVTNPVTGKHATCTDIGRRAWASRNCGQMTPQEMQAWMRHADIRTTMRYYVHHDAAALAAKAWREKSHLLGDPTPLAESPEEKGSS